MYTISNLENNDIQIMKNFYSTIETFSKICPGYNMAIDYRNLYQNCESYLTYLTLNNKHFLVQSYLETESVILNIAYKYLKLNGITNFDTNKYDIYIGKNTLPINTEWHTVNSDRIILTFFIKCSGKIQIISGLIVNDFMIQSNNVLYIDNNIKRKYIAEAEEVIIIEFDKK